MVGSFSRIQVLSIEIVRDELEESLVARIYVLLVEFKHEYDSSGGSSNSSLLLVHNLHVLPWVT